MTSISGVTRAKEAIEARRASFKSRITIVLLLVLALISVSCTPVGEAPEATRTPSTESSVEAPPEVATRLLYLDGRSLNGFDLSTGASQTIRELPSADAALSPDGQTLVYVQESHPQGEGPEGFRDPVLMAVGTTKTAAPTELGTGRAPTWSPDGTEVAAIAPTENGETIVVYGVPGGPRPTAAPGNELWAMVGWTDDGVVAIGGRSGVVRVSASDNSLENLAVEPSELWGVSPTDRTQLTIGSGEAVFADQVETERPAPSSTVTGEGRGALGDGTWSWDGRTIAAVRIGGRAITDLVLIDVATGAAATVENGRGAQGHVVWTDDGNTFAFVRVKPDQRGRLEAVVCEGAARCEPAFSWDEGVTLLGFG